VARSELDLCFSCHGIWFDPQENLKLSPAAVVELFRLLHAHRDAARQPLTLKMDCPRCSQSLAQGFDVCAVAATSPTAADSGTVVSARFHRS